MGARACTSASKTRLHGCMWVHAACKHKRAAYANMPGSRAAKACAVVARSLVAARRLQMEEQSLLKVKGEQELLVQKLSDSSGAAYV